MTKLRDYLGLIALIGGPTLAVLGWLNTQSKLNRTVAVRPEVAAPPTYNGDFFPMF